MSCVENLSSGHGGCFSQNIVSQLTKHGSDSRCELPLSNRWKHLTLTNFMPIT
eukprot:m.363807 g.363807  ORF g.363807 m.363807 type:complete len:53 (+) comp16654_c0_seq35:822-980(+)